MPEAAAIIRRFDEPDERRDSALGLFEPVQIGGMTDGRVVDFGPGDLFEIGPGHDSVVIGDEPYVTIHFFGADQYGTI